MYFLPGNPSLNAVEAYRVTGTAVKADVPTACSTCPGPLVAFGQGLWRVALPACVGSVAGTASAPWRHTSVRSAGVLVPRSTLTTSQNGRAAARHVPLTVNLWLPATPSDGGCECVCADNLAGNTRVRVDAARPNLGSMAVSQVSQCMFHILSFPTGSDSYTRRAHGVAS